MMLCLITQQQHHRVDIIKPMAKPTSSPFTILIVDDVPSNIALLLQMLRAEGYRTLVAESGERALAQLAYTIPDLILLDGEMPGLSGFETCQQIKKHEQTKHIPVIFLTVLDDVDSKIRGFNVGGSDYITKPFETAEVLARVRTHLTLKSLLQQLQDKNRWLEREVSTRATVLRETDIALQSERERRQQQEQEITQLFSLLKQQSEQLQGLTNLLSQTHSAPSQVQPPSLLIAPTQQPADSALNSLTNREQEVLALWADGLNSQEVAAQLNLSTVTIRTYRSRIMKKLNIRHTPGLVKFALKHNLTTLD